MTNQEFNRTLGILVDTLRECVSASNKLAKEAFAKEPYDKEMGKVRELLTLSTTIVKAAASMTNTALRAAQKTADGK